MASEAIVYPKYTAERLEEMIRNFRDETPPRIKSVSVTYRYSKSDLRAAGLEPVQHEKKGARRRPGSKRRVPC